MNVGEGLAQSWVGVAQMGQLGVDAAGDELGEKVVRGAGTGHADNGLLRVPVVLEAGFGAEEDVELRRVGNVAH